MRVLDRGSIILASCLVVYACCANEQARSPRRIFNYITITCDTALLGGGRPIGVHGVMATPTSRELIPVSNPRFNFFPVEGAAAKAQVKT